MPSSSLLTLLEIWQTKLKAWAAEGAISQAAKSALALEGNQPLLQELESAMAKGDFSGLPAVELLPASSMPGAAGAYALSTGKVYLNQDWFKTASEEKVIAVLTEELGHHLDAQFNEIDSPGDEGKFFAGKLLKQVLSVDQKQVMGRQGDQIEIWANGERINAEASFELDPIIRGDRLYTFVDGPSWTQAGINAQALGGYLVSINDFNENEFVNKNLALTLDERGETDYFIEDNWLWIGVRGNTDTTISLSSGEVFEYNNWHDEEGPNDPQLLSYLSSIGYTGVLEPSTRQNGEWSALRGTDHNGSTKNVDPNGHDISGIAEISFVRRGDSAYIVVEGSTWEEAEANANALGGNLVAINDKLENDWIIRRFLDNYEENLFIGATYREQEGVWKWTNGDSFGYTNWFSGETNHHDGGGEDFSFISGAPINGDRFGFWNNTKEISPKFGLAEISLAPNNSPTGTPILSGDFKVGESINIDVSAIDDVDNFDGWSPAYEYSWEVSNDDGTIWTDLTNTDANDGDTFFTLTTDELGKQLRGVVSYLDGYGTNEVLRSDDLFNEVPKLTGQKTLLTNGTEDLAYTINATDLLQGYSDPDGDTLSVTSLITSIGVLVDNNDGTWTLSFPQDFNGNIDLSYSVIDGNGGSIAATQSFSLTPVNDAPILSGTPHVFANGTEDLEYKIKVAALLQGYSDPDGDTLSVTSLITSIGVLVDNNDGTWTLSTPQDFNGKIDLSYSITDSNNASIAATQSLSLTPVNDAPILSSSPVVLPNGTEDLAYTINATDLLQGYSDPDGDTLSVTSLITSIGVLVDNNDGTWTLSFPQDFNGNIDLSYSVSDGKGGSIAATQSLSLTPVNDAPILSSSPVVLPNGTEDLAYTINATDLLQGYSDPDGDTLSVTSLITSIGVLVDNNDGTWTLSFPKDFNGNIDLSYSVSDGKGGSIAATQSLSLTPVNDAPILSSSPVVLPNGTEDLAYTINASDLLQGYSDPDGDTLSVTSLITSIGVLVDNNDGTWTLSFPQDFNGNIDLSYSVSDGKGGSIAATQSFSLTPVNDVPILSSSPVVLPNGTEDLAYTINATDLLQGYSDPDGDTLSVTSLITSIGVLVDNNDGTWTLSFPKDFNGNIDLSYSVSDGKGGSIAATQSLSLTPVNDAPILSSSPVVLPNGTEDLAYTINASDLLQGYSDPDGDTLSVTSLITSIGVLVDNNDGTWTLSFPQDFNGNIDLSYSVSDGKGGSIAATQSFSLTPVNDVPILSSSPAVLASEPEDLAYTINATDLLQGYSDPDGDTLSVTSLITSIGVLVDNNDGTWTLSFPKDFNGNIDLSYSVSDGKGGSIAATQSLSLTPVNDVPILSSSPVVLPNGTEDLAYTINASDLLQGYSDPDGDTLSVTSLITSIGVLVDNNDGTWTLSFPQDFNGNIDLSYSVSDGKGGSIAATQSFSLTPVNDAPILSSSPVVLPNGTEDLAYTINATDLLQGYSDPDGDTLSVTSLITSIGVLVDNNDGTWTLSFPKDFNGNIDLSYSVSDGKGGSIAATQSLSLTPVNDAPILSSSPVVLPNGTEDLAYTINATDLLQGYSDPDGDTLSVTSLITSIGVLVDNNDGTWTLSFPKDFNGNIDLSYSVSDGKGGSIAATQSLSLTPVNDAPILSSSPVVLPNGTEDLAYTINASDLLQGYSDPDGDTLSVTSLITSIGVLVDNNDGTWTLSFPKDFNGNIDLSYSVSDGKGGSIAATQSLSLTPVNDVPILSSSPVVLPNGTEDLAYTINATDLLQGYSDPDGDTLSVTSLITSIGVLVDNNDGTWTLSFPQDFNGNIDLSYSVSDGKGGSIAATQSLSLTPVNDAPILSSSPVGLPNGTEDLAYTINASDLLQGYSDPDGDTLSVTSLITSIGVLVDNNDGTWTLSFPQDFNGNIDLSYSVSDGKGGSIAATQSFSLTPVNDAPTDLSLSETTFEENITSDSIIANLSSTDEDSGDTHTYSLVPGDGDTDNSAFTIDGNKLSINASPDYETQDSYSVRLKTTDSGGLTFEKAFTFAVNDLNESPTSISSSKSSFKWWIEDGSYIASLSTTDEDSENTHTYSLVSGEGDTDNNLFTLGGNRVSINSIDNNLKETYSIRIQTEDNNGLIYQNLLKFKVSDYDVLETNNAGRKLIEDQGRNVVIPRRFTKIGNAFERDSVDSIVIPDSVVEIQDYAFQFQEISSIVIPGSVKKIGEEAFAGSTTLSSVTLENGVSEIGAASFHELEKLTYISIPGSVKTIQSEAFAGSSLASVELENGIETIGYGAFFNNKLGSSSIELEIPETVTSIGDYAFYENKLKRVSIPDSVITIGTGAFGNNPLESISISEDATFDLSIFPEGVEIIRRSGNTSPTDLSTSASSFNENIAAASAVATLSSTDTDSEDTHTYSLVSGDGDSDNNAFTIVGDELKVKSSPDYETQDSYSVRLQTRDSGGLTFEKSFTLNVNDLSENLDSDSDGFVDGSSNYQLFNSGTEIDLTNKNGTKYSDASTTSWDASMAVQSNDGWKVLLDGDSTYSGQFYIWDVNASGIITKGSGWKTTNQALEAGWESIFGDVIIKDSVIGISATDTNNDGLVDNWSTYRLTDGSSSIQIRNSNGKTYSDASTTSWDASMAVQSNDGWKVLLDGDSTYSGQFYIWDVNASGIITKGSGWKTTNQALEAGWESIFGDVIIKDSVIGISATDTNNDGLVDNWSTYRLTDGSSSIQIRNSNGKTYSDASTTSWDASMAVQSNDGWKVLLDGDSTYSGQFYIWDVNASGIITKGSGWKTTNQALEAGWESIFGDVIIKDSVIGISATDTNNDGLVDNWSTYRLTDGSSSIQIRNSNGKTYSDASTTSWDASMAVQSNDGWKVLLDGDSTYSGQFYIWDVNASGIITKGSGWKTTNQALEAGWESIFGDVIIKDSVIGISATDTNNDGLVDNWSTYRLTDGSSSIQIRNSNGKTYSDASTTSWDASMAVQSNDGWKVLLDGDSTYSGQFYIWDVNASGIITKGSGWKTTNQALEAGWESIFGDVIIKDSVIGISATDTNNDGLVDNWSTYRLTDGSSSIQIRNSNGKTYSDASTTSWDASMAVQSNDGWKVLLDGDSTYSGQFYIWDVNASGIITKGSGWKTTNQALEAGWESIFGDVIIKDSVIGISATDTNNDGLVDNWSTYRLTDGSSSIQIRNSNGKTYSDASTTSWDASMAVQSNDGWKVLLDGDSTYSGQFYIWDVNASGIITKGSGWKTTNQALEAGWESIFGDVIIKDSVIGISATDTNNDGLVDNWSTYRLTDGSSSIQLRNSNGKTYSDASTTSWDASMAVQSNDGWKVLLDGDSTYSGQFYIWDVNASGIITKGSGWKTTNQALEAGWESIFGDVIIKDSVIGISATDTNNDGLVDNWSTYRLTDGSSSIQLRNSNGKTYSDASTTSWDASKAVQSNDGWKVLLDGDSTYSGQFYIWDVNASGIITKGSGWKTTNQALEAGWESIFGDVIIKDSVIGISATDTNNDGLVDNWSTYRLTDGSSSIQLRNSNGKTYSDASTTSWDASKAVQSNDGWKVLLDGDSTYSGQFYIWDVNASGIITKGSGWKTTNQALEAGWEELFGNIINSNGSIDQLV